MANKYFVYNKNTGAVTRIGTRDEILLSNIEQDEDISVFNKAASGQIAFLDDKDALSKSSVPENIITNSSDLFSNEIPGPIDYTTTNRLLQSTDVVARLVLGGQHVTGTTLSGNFSLNTTGSVKFLFNNFTEFEQLKTVRGDHFQILDAGTTLDGIYKVRGFDSFQVNAEKVTGNTASLGSSGSFNLRLPYGHNIIRLQPVAGTPYGLSASVEGVGSYQFGENIEQSRYKVETAGNVTHNSSVKKFNSASARFVGNQGLGTTGPYLYVDSNPGFTFDGTSKYLFKLSTFVKFDSASPTSEQVICCKKNNKTGVGAYLLKYDNSPSSFVFTYSTNDSSSSFNKTMVASNMAGVTLNDWTHIQVEFGDVEGRLYTNGTLKATQALGATEEIFQDADVPFVIGAESQGTSPFDGYLDHLEVSFDKVSVIGSDHFLDGGASAGTLALGTSMSVPSFGNTGAIGGSADYTKLRFPMNGIDGSKLFVESSLSVTEGISRVYDEDRRVLSITNYGFTGGASGFNTAYGYLRGSNMAGGNTSGIIGNSEATHPILDVQLGITTGLTFESYKTNLFSLEDVRVEREKLGAGMSGATANFGDFVHSFGGVTGVATAGVFGTGGTGASASTAGLNQLTFYASDENTARLTEINDLVGVCAAKSEDIFYFTNTSGLNFGVFGYEVSRMLTDVLIFRSGRSDVSEEEKSDIENADSFEKLAKGGKAGVVKVVPPTHQVVGFGDK